MRKFQLKDFMKSAAAFGLVSASGIDAWLYALDRAGWLKTSGDMYLVGPLVSWGIVSIPLSISLAERMINSAYKRPGQITPIVTESNGTARAIPYNRNGVAGTLMAHAVKSILGEPASAPKPVRQVAGWNVPLESGDIVWVGVMELSKFLELCDRRPKHKFSMRYWTQKRRPPMPRKKYDGFMNLLTRAGLIEARQHGASGWLRGGLKPRHAVQYLTDPNELPDLTVFTV